jgi:hypothetical protein
VTEKARGDPNMNRPLCERPMDKTVLAPTKSSLPSRYGDPSQRQQLRSGQKRGRRATKPGCHGRKKESRRRRLQNVI